MRRTGAAPAASSPQGPCRGLLLRAALRDPSAPSVPCAHGDDTGPERPREAGAVGQRAGPSPSPCGDIRAGGASPSLGAGDVLPGAESRERAAGAEDAAPACFRHPVMTPAGPRGWCVGSVFRSLPSGAGSPAFQGLCVYTCVYRAFNSLSPPGATGLCGAEINSGRGRPAGSWTADGTALWGWGTRCPRLSAQWRWALRAGMAGVRG